MVLEIFEFLWMWGLERTESPFPKMDTSKNGLFWWVDDLPKFWELAVIWLRYIPNDFDSRSKLSEWEHNLWLWFLDIQSWKMLCNADSSHYIFIFQNHMFTKNITKGISTFDQRKSLYKVQGLDQKTQMVLSRVFSSWKFDSKLTWLIQ